MNRNVTAALAALCALVAVPTAGLLAAVPAAWEWDIGPVIRGKNYSVNMPRTMRETADGPAFDFPYPRAANGHVHYVTVPIGPLEGAERITIRYRIDAAPGTRFHPQEDPQNPATMSLYFQRDRDRWTMRTPQHRWYAPENRVMPLSRGTHTVSIALDEPWIAMTGGSNLNLPDAYSQALQDTARIGFVFGSPSLRGHGVYATAPARFTLLDFKIE